MSASNLTGKILSYYFKFCFFVILFICLELIFLCLIGHLAIILDTVAFLKCFLNVFLLGRKDDFSDLICVTFYLF